MDLAASGVDVNAPAGKELRAELRRLADDEHCPEDVGAFVKKKLMEGDALTIEKAEWLRENTVLKIEESKAILAEDAAFDDGDDDLPFG